MTTAIDCPECGHDIDMHDMADGCDHDENVSADAWVPCPCGLAPSGVAEAMLSGPPTDAEIAAVVAVTWPDREKSWELSPLIAAIAEDRYVRQARALLEAAAKVRIGR